jgi:hypothetical protein
MPPTAFTLQIPADARYAAVAADAARKFVELMGGATAEGVAFAAALTDSLADLAGRTNGPLLFAFSLQPAGVEVVVTAGPDSTSVVRHPLAAGQR